MIYNIMLIFYVKMKYYKVTDGETIISSKGLIKMSCFVFLC